MVKTKLFSSNKSQDFENWLNEFIRDKKIIDIKYSSYILPTHYSNGMIDAIDLVDRVLVIYEED